MYIYVLSELVIQTSILDEIRAHALNNLQYIGYAGQTFRLNILTFIKYLSSKSVLYYDRFCLK